MPCLRIVPALTGMNPRGARGTPRAQAGMKARCATWRAARDRGRLRENEIVEGDIAGAGECENAVSDPDLDIGTSVEDIGAAAAVETVGPIAALKGVVAVPASVRERQELTNPGLVSTARCCGRPRHRQTDSVGVCSPASRCVATLRPRFAGLATLTPAPRTPSDWLLV